MEWPDKLILSGSDYFQLLLDRHYRQYGSQGNTSRFVVNVKGQLNAGQLEQTVNNDTIFRWLHSLRIKRQFPFRLSQWKQIKTAHSIPIRIHEINQKDYDIPNEFFKADIQPHLDPPFKLDLIYHRNDQTTLFLTWSHILLDSQGAEILVRHLGNATGNKPVQLLASNNAEFSITKKLAQAREIRNFMFLDKKKTDISFLLNKHDSRYVNRYHLVRFSETETEQIITNSRCIGAQFGRSPFLLAAAMHSFKDLLKRKGEFYPKIWVPIPQNQRKKGAVGPLAGNQLSYLFYRVFPQQLESMQKTVEVIRQQMIDQMRSNIPASFCSMMELMRWIPLWLYGYIIKSPTQGALASFFFSDTGKTLDDFKSFCGLPVSDAIHYPPHSSHPGFTIIFMDFQQKLQAIIAYNENVVNKEDIFCFESSIRKNLLG